MNDRMFSKRKSAPPMNRVTLGVKVRKQDKDEWDRILRNNDLLHAPQLFAEMIKAYKQNNVNV